MSNRYTELAQNRYFSQAMIYHCIQVQYKTLSTFQINDPLKIVTLLQSWLVTPSFLLHN